MGLAVLLGAVVWMSLKPNTQEGAPQPVFNTSGKYISVVDWPPLAQMIDGPLTCTEAGAVGDRAGQTIKKIINGRTYCVTSVMEGAAGSRYTQYAYATGLNGKTLIFTFSTRASQCENYEPEERVACFAEQEAFNPDPLIDELVIKQEHVGTQNLGEVSSRRTNISGTFVCLPHTDSSGPQTLECALGLHATDGSYYALDFNQLSQADAGLKTGDRFSADGVLTPVEMLSSDHWKKYPIKGIFTITGSIKKF